MDRQLIEALIDVLERSSLSELEYARDGVNLRLVKGPVVRHAAAAEPVAERPSSVTPVTAAPSGIVASPLYGVVHLRPAPDAAPFVSLGQAVVLGQVLCTVEAMKVFTELRAERAGTVLAIAVAGGQEVEAGQTLMELA